GVGTGASRAGCRSRACRGTCLLLRPRRHGVTTITLRDAALNHPFDKELHRGAARGTGVGTALALPWERTGERTGYRKRRMQAAGVSVRARATRAVAAAAGLMALLALQPEPARFSAVASVPMSHARALVLSEQARRYLILQYRS